MGGCVFWDCYADGCVGGYFCLPSCWDCCGVDGVGDVVEVCSLSVEEHLCAFAWFDGGVHI